ncbi:hypothetical protein RGQ29_025416 [Quercus rubra]|uniref:Peroxidase n=1 Tax=Quercus rubra TaxID=3512 RepID=A0AAN7IQK4_QUERU|nr:hypothetical protein RGQ29_025416 [Quercus rubra]
MAPFFSIPSILTTIKFFLLFSFLVGMVSAQLSSTFYATSCPNALSTIKSAVDSAVSSEPRMGASLLRLHFHDCFVNGCDASVLLDEERQAPPNKNSIRGFEVIDTIKSQLEDLCPGVVSCADILAVTARDSVVALDGLGWTVELGRRDSATASGVAASSNLPSPFSSLSELINKFSNKGFTVKEMVALSDSSFTTSLQSNCPSTGGDSNLAPLDVTSSESFDNEYFNNLISKKGLLHSDQQLFNEGSTDSLVNAYSTNSESFLTDFANAMVKMGELSPLTGTSGQIRTNCNKAN